MKNRKTGKAIAAAAMLTIAAMTMPMQTVSAEDIVDAPYNVVVWVTVSAPVTDWRIPASLMFPFWNII